MLPETIKSRVRIYYKANYATYLTQTEANHADDPITLVDFKDHIFSNARVFQTGLRQYPYSEFSHTVSRAETEAQQSALAGQWGTLIEIRYKFRDTDLERLAKTIDRHQEATLLMFAADERLGGALPQGFRDPEFRLIESTDPFLQGLVVRIRVRHKV